MGKGSKAQADSSALSSQKFHNLVWDVNHASGLEKVAESKLWEGWGQWTWWWSRGLSWEWASGISICSFLGWGGGCQPQGT